MKVVSVLSLLPLMASTVQGGLIRDLMSYGSETVSELEEVASEAVELTNAVAEEIQDVAAEELAGKDPHRSLQWYYGTYHKPWWCYDGATDLEWFCKGKLGQFGTYKYGRSCYDTVDDCECMSGYTKINGQCAIRNCASDPQWFCMALLGQHSGPAHWGCIEDVHDCQCHYGYKEIDGECRKCAHDEWAFCREQLGDYGKPRWGRSCYVVPSDCQCYDGYLIHDGTCVQDPCQPGEDYAHGECHPRVNDCHTDPLEFCRSICGPHGIPREGHDCIKALENCQCEAGTSPWDGTCLPPAGGFGDPHFITFHGHEFQFHGECDLVLVKAPAIDLDVHVRTTIRYDYSFISQAALKLGDHTFEVGSWGEYQLDGISTPDLPLVIGRYHIAVEILNDIKKKYRFTIRHLDAGRSIDVVSLKDYVAVKFVNTTEVDFFEAVGLMGHYTKGDMIARDGETNMEGDPDAFGQEWQVRPEEDGQIFSDAREPQYPHSQCRMPPPNAINARDRKLGESMVSREDAEAACMHVSQHRNNCIEDVLRSRDIEMALVY